MGIGKSFAAKGSRCLGIPQSKQGWGLEKFQKGVSQSFPVAAAALLILFGLTGNARANLYGTVWDLAVNFWVGSGDYIQMTGDGNGDSFKYQNGTFTHNDSTMDFWGNAQIGLNNWAIFYQNGGTMNVGGWLSIARYGGSGYLEVNGGLV
ncbi:MAG: hypothetical protein EBZ05_07580, partial [Verrucomicrobia bacterium]|nr:hypothetical protein [Verrucomicrobiota bacterium]